MDEQQQQQQQQPSSSSFSPTSISTNKEENKKKFLEFYRGSKERKFQGLSIANKCNSCWLLYDFCICKSIESTQLQHEYIICFHPTEWTRSSNTGKLILLSDQFNSNNNTTTTTTTTTTSQSNNINNNDKDNNSTEQQQQNKEYQESVYNNLNNNSKKTSTTTTTTTTIPEPPQKTTTDLITTEEPTTNTPLSSSSSSSDIITIKDSLKKINIDETLKKELPKLTVIIVDGTWNQAKSLNKRLPPEITRVHLEFGELKFLSMFNVLRTQPQVDRISTLEATILTMKHIGESHQDCLKLVSNFQLLIDHLLDQTHKREAVENKKWIGNSKNQKSLQRNKYDTN
eukprot:gene1361-1718_t